LAIIICGVNGVYGIIKSTLSLKDVLISFMPLSNNLDNNSSEYSFKNMPQPQKIAVISLSVVGVTIIFFGILQFRARVNNPFQYNGASTSTLATTVSLMDTDTDKDGLSDYDEANVYQTSRYLPDSDSDGILDGEEIKNETDPNCPVGQNCLGGQDFLASATNTTPVVESVGSLGVISIASGTNETELKSALAGEVDAATLRKLLIDGGASQETLNQISDEDLLKSYQEVLNKQNE
jgi:hypothetical protein